MDNERYEKILREGKRVDWYGVEVPLELINATAKLIVSNISEEINKLESTIDGLRGTDLDKRKKYIGSLKINLQNIPYELNGDFYLIKKKRIESEIEKERQKTNTGKRKTTTNKTATTKKVITKNSDLIFGKNKK